MKVSDLSPLPWRQDPEHRYTVEDANGERVCNVDAPENAAAISEAVNSHSRLTEEVRGLREALQSVRNVLHAYNRPGASLPNKTRLMLRDTCDKALSKEPGNG